MSTCKKCDQEGTVLLRKKDFYCQSCFLTNINHRFRACIGKNKILSKNENVLICLSGGPASTALLDFIHYGVSLDNNKKLWITPVFLHIIERQNGDHGTLIAKALAETCNTYKFNIHITHIFEYVLKSKENLNENIPEVDSTAETQFEALIESIPISSKNDFLVKVKRDLFIRYGKALKCKYIFTAETSETLAINLLSNLSNGRGSQVQHDIGFCDNRDEVNIIRPMRDISQEELQNYIKIKKLVAPNIYENTYENSIQVVIKQFVTDLQQNFQSTISTVCKTADKIGNNEEKPKQRCKLCESGIGQKVYTLSALEATNYSRNVSLGHINNRNNQEWSSLFPHVNEYLCYTCSRHFSEIDKTHLPIHLREMSNILMEDNTC